MKIQTYICSSSFPNEIQEALINRGFYVEPLPEAHHETNSIHGAFSFRVTKQSDTLRVLGVEYNGQFGFHIIEDPSDNTDAHGASGVSLICAPAAALSTLFRRMADRQLRNFVKS